MSHQAPCDAYKKRNYICKTGHNCYWLWVFTPSSHGSTSVERLTDEKVRENLFHDYSVRWGREGWGHCLEVKFQRCMMENLVRKKTFEGTFSVIELSVFVFIQTTGYRVYTVSREPIRFIAEIQYPVFIIHYIVLSK